MKRFFRLVFPTLLVLIFIKSFTAFIYAVMGFPLKEVEGVKGVFIFGAVFWIIYNAYLIVKSIRKKFSKKNLLLKIIKICFIIYGISLVVFAFYSEFKYEEESFSGIYVLTFVVMIGLFYFLYSVYARDFYYMLGKSLKHSSLSRIIVDSILIGITYLIKDNVGPIPSFILILDSVSSIGFDFFVKVLSKHSSSNNIYREFFIKRFKYHRYIERVSLKTTFGYLGLMLLFSGFTVFAAYVAFIFAFAGLGMIYTGSAGYLLELTSQSFLFESKKRSS